MVTPTTAEVSQRTRKPTVVEIDGFRGRLIGAGHPDYDTARALWNGVIDRRATESNRKNRVWLSFLLLTGDR